MRHPFEPPIILDIMPADFIFMLTRNDRTVADADAHLDTALACGVRHIGFKDIGQPPAVLRRLNATIRAAGARSYLEVVSQDRDSELASVRAASGPGGDRAQGGLVHPAC
ncbi:4-hydroxythreonine-4-phosphate dehydrogenase, partial [Achromobacter ruhlandii]|nr:4-hydroxythreonine-4-phosphate dehydrogenase [Achromobacter ruhlandii]